MKLISVLGIGSLLLCLGACSDDDSGGGSGGSAGSAGSGGGGASCEACVACVNANCSTEVADCQTDTECKAIYDCSAACLPSGQDMCVTDHPAGVTKWAATVSQCLNQHCLAPCSY